MPKIEATRVDEIIGWQPTDDRKHALLALRSGQNELVLAVSEANLLDFITSLVGATDAFPLQKGLGDKQLLALDPKWFELGQDNRSDKMSLSFWFDHGHLAFHVSRSMAQQMHEVLATALQGGSNPPPGSTRN